MVCDASYRQCDCRDEIRRWKVKERKKIGISRRIAGRLKEKGNSATRVIIGLNALD